MIWKEMMSRYILKVLEDEDVKQIEDIDEKIDYIRKEKYIWHPRSYWPYKVWLQVCKEYREILKKMGGNMISIYKGKRKDTNKWINGYLIKKDDKFFIFKEWDIKFDSERRCSVYCIEVIPETVGMFTGFYDETGKAIYEGDIVQLDIDDGLLGVVFWNKNIGCWDVRDNEGMTYWDVYTGLPPLKVNNVWVIGSIHDNPNLLKGGNHDD